jgi:hypothetical protein
VTADGHVRIGLRQLWADGTTHVVFDPVESNPRRVRGRGAENRPSVNLSGSYAAYRPPAGGVC